MGKRRKGKEENRHREGRGKGEGSEHWKGEEEDK